MRDLPEKYKNESEEQSTEVETMRRMTLIALLAIGMLLVSCAKTPEAERDVDAEPFEEIQTDLDGIETISDELDFTDLETLDEDLNFG